MRYFAFWTMHFLEVNKQPTNALILLLILLGILLFTYFSFKKVKRHPNCEVTSYKMFSMKKTVIRN
jgi:hypothetical protein